MKIVKLSILVIPLLVASCGKGGKKKTTVKTLPAGVTETYSGLRHQVLRKGKGGPTPNSLCTVKVHYVGKTTDGKVFDSSYERGKPAEFPLDQVIEGWTEGLQLMTKGEKRRFWIPSRLAYGDNPGLGKPGGDLIFDVELLDFHQ
jgi:FKBP-type peptidyl-prolyl cis-trans isomerase